MLSHGQQRRVRPTDKNHALIREYLSGTRVAVTQDDRRLKFKSLKQYCLIDGKLHAIARTATANEARSVPRDEEVFDIIIQAHLGLVHAGRDKTFQEIERTTSGVSKKEVSEVLRHCATCSKKGSQRSKARLHPIVENTLWGRVQIDLIDMRGDSDDGQKWICHMRDHFSKYSIATPMANKTSIEVVKVVLMWIMHFGPPKILQSDNGTEFKGALSILLQEHGIKVINGRPRHPQSQGMVEQANGVLKEKIAAWRSDHQSASWVSSLPEVIAGMNSQCSSVTGKSAYEVVFGQAPHGERVSYLVRDVAQVADEDLISSAREDGFSQDEMATTQGSSQITTLVTDRVLLDVPASAAAEPGSRIVCQSYLYLLIQNDLLITLRTLLRVCANQRMPDTPDIKTERPSRACTYHNQYTCSGSGDCST